MPTKSNNTGGRGGARAGAGRKKKEPTDKKNITVLNMPNIEGTDMPSPREFLESTQQNGKQLQATDIYKETWEWLKDIGCSSKVSKQLLERYAMSSARWIQCEEMISEVGFLAQHPTTKNPIPSQYINIGINYMNQANRLWNEIYQIAKENGEYTSNKEDPMELLLRRK